MEVKIERDDSPSEVVEKFIEALLEFGIIVTAEYGEDSATLELKKLR